MNSTRPTTFVEAPQAAAASFAVACLAVIALGVTQAIAASQGAASAARLRAAEVLPRGPDRDAALARAQLAIADALAVAPKDAALHARKARAFYLQAATATLPDVSPALLDAAEAAAREAASASRHEAGAAAVRAMVALARNNFLPDEATAAAVTESYAGRARDPETALWRVQAAGAAWSLLPAGVKLRAVDEACALLAAPATAERAAPAALRMGDDLGTCTAGTETKD